MAKDTIKFLKVREVKSPSRANKYDAGVDFYVPEFTEQFRKDLLAKNPKAIIHGCFNEEKNVHDYCLILKPGGRILIPSGVHCQMADTGRALIAANKSGVATKHGLVFGAQVVDYEYQGEIHLSLINTSDDEVVITPGMKIIQFLEMPVYNSTILTYIEKTVNEFYSEETTRGARGFGSTDNK
jgi:dUTP pyrophosphatase